MSLLSPPSTPHFSSSPFKKMHRSLAWAPFLSSFYTISHLRDLKKRDLFFLLSLHSLHLLKLHLLCVFILLDLYTPFFVRILFFLLFLFFEKNPSHHTVISKMMAAPRLDLGVPRNMSELSPLIQSPLNPVYKPTGVFVAPNNKAEPPLRMSHKGTNLLPSKNFIVFADWGPKKMNNEQNSTPIAMLRWCQVNEILKNVHEKVMKNGRAGYKAIYKPGKEREYELDYKSEAVLAILDEKDPLDDLDDDMQLCHPAGILRRFPFQGIVPGYANGHKFIDVSAAGPVSVMNYWPKVSIQRRHILGLKLERETKDSPYQYVPAVFDDYDITKLQTVGSSIDYSVDIAGLKKVTWNHAIGRVYDFCYNVNSVHTLTPLHTLDAAGTTRISEGKEDMAKTQLRIHIEASTF